VFEGNLLYEHSNRFRDSSTFRSILIIPITKESNTEDEYPADDEISTFKCSSVENETDKDDDIKKANTNRNDPNE